MDWILDFIRELIYCALGLSILLGQRKLGIRIPGIRLIGWGILLICLENIGHGLDHNADFFVDRQLVLCVGIVAITMASIGTLRAGLYLGRVHDLGTRMLADQCETSESGD